MKHINISILTFFVLFSVAIFVFAEEENLKGIKIAPGPGMELRKVGNAYIIVPKDAKVETRNNILFVEDASQYAARRLAETGVRLDGIDKKIAGIEKKQEDLIKEIEQLKKAIANIQK